MRDRSRTAGVAVALDGALSCHWAREESSLTARSLCCAGRRQRDGTDETQRTEGRHAGSGVPRGRRPHLPTLERYSGEYTPSALEEWVGREYVDSAQTNEPQLQRKSRWVGAATTLLFIEAILLALAAFWTLR